MANEKEPVLLVYIGTFYQKKKYQGWLEVTEEQFKSGEYLKYKDEDILLYNKIEKSPGRPGTVYVFQRTIGGTTIRQGGEWKGFWQNSEQRQKWQAEEDARQALLEVNKERNKEGRRNLIREAAEPLRKLYNNEKSYSRKAVLLALMIAYITSGHAAVIDNE